MNRKRIYFAAPLFTQAEWCWNQSLAKRLEESGLGIALPQRTAKPMLDGKAPFESGKLFALNVEAIKRANAMLAVFDQPDPDSGTAWECGYAYAAGIPIFGLRTDLRRLTEGGPESVNLMLARSCTAFIEVPPQRRSDIHWVARQVCLMVRKWLK